MNALDNLLLIIFVAVLLIYCYKKKKFPFSKLRKGDETKETEPAPNGTSAPNIYPFPQMFSPGAQYPFAVYTPTPPRPTYCKLVGVDKEVIDSDMNIEHVINTELQKLVATCCTVQSVSAVSYNTAENAERILFCITYSN